MTLVLVPTFLGPIVSARAQSADLKQVEIGTFDLTASGIAGTAHFAEQLRAEFEGRMDVELESTLSDIEVGPATPEPKRSDGDIEFSVEGSGPQRPVDLEVAGRAPLADSRGTVKTPAGNRQLPLDVSVEFRFNDHEIADLVEIAGRPGHFEMNVSVENRTGVLQTVEYLDTTSSKKLAQEGFVFLPITLGIGPWFFANNNWSNVVVDGAQVDQVGTDTVVSSAQVLFPPLLPGETTVRLSGDVSSFDLTSARIYAMVGLDAELPPEINSIVEHGGGQTYLLFAGLKEFLDNFLTMTAPPPAQGLPFLAEGLGEAVTGLDELKIFGTLASSIIAFMPTIEETLAGLDISAIQAQIAELVGTLAGTLGSSTYTRPSCKPGIDPALCNLATYQVPELPPVPRSTGGTLTAIAQNPSTGATETYARTTSPLGELVGTPLSEGSYVGSLYNWAAFLGFSASPPVDANLDGVADFEPFSWPDPNDPTYAPLYTTQAIDTVAIDKGSIWPGAGLGPSAYTTGTPTQPGVNATFARPSKLFAGICQLSGPFYDSAFKLGADDFAIECPDLPSEDVTLGDLITGAAQGKIGTAKATVEKLCLRTGGTEVPPAPGPCDPSLLTAGEVTIEGEIDFGELVVQGTDLGLQNALQSQPFDWTITCDSFTDAVDPGPISQFRVIVQVLCGPDASYPYATTPTVATYHGQGFLTPDITGFPFEDLIIPVFDEGCFYPTDAFLPGQQDPSTKLTCDNVFKGHLGLLAAASESIKGDLYSPAWNFDNWYRRDPGFQFGDTGPTAPALEQVLSTIIPFDVDRAAARCPETIVTGPGTGTPRVRPPERTVACDTVLPDTSSSTLFENAIDILDAVGSPSDPEFVRGRPADLLTAVDVLATKLVGVPSSVEALQSSLSRVIDSTLDIIAKVLEAADRDAVFVAEVATAQETADLNSALTKAGLERAREYAPFMGPARTDGKKADARVVLVFEIQGVKP